MLSLQTAQCWRAALEFTTRFLTAHGQGVGQKGQRALHTHKTLQVGTLSCWQGGEVGGEGEWVGTFGYRVRDGGKWDSHTWLAAVRGQDEAIPTQWLATGAVKIELFCPLGMGLYLCTIIHSKFLFNDKVY